MAGSNRNIAFSRQPARCLRQPGQHIARKHTHTSLRRCVPARIRGDTIFISYPAYGRLPHIKDHSVRLMLFNEANNTGPVIFPSFGTSPVEPHLNKRPVLSQQLCQLFGVEIVVSFLIGITGLVPIPWRQIQPESNAFLATSVSDLTHYVPPAVLPRTGFHRIISCLCWPQTKAIMMFGCQNQIFKTRPFSCTNPLTCIKLGWIKLFWRIIATAPFLITKRIHAEMTKHAEFHVMPSQLLLCW